MTRKLILSALVLFLSFQFSVAQNRIYTGIKSGFSSSSFLNDSSMNYDNRKALSGGVNSLFTFEKVKRFAIMSELNFLQLGNKFLQQGALNTHKMNYIALNLKPRYYIGMLGKAKSGIYLEAGPYAGYLVSANHFTTQNEDVHSTGVINDFNSFDFGADLGIGWSLMGFLSFDVNYHLGLAPIEKVSSGYNLRNSAFGVFMNLAIPIYKGGSPNSTSKSVDLKKS